MQIKKLTLKDYRSYQNKTFEFSNKVNILVGKNAQGKTNVVEAIFFMIIGKNQRPQERNGIQKTARNRAHQKKLRAKQAAGCHLKQHKPFSFFLLTDSSEQRMPSKPIPCAKISIKLHISPKQICQSCIFILL